MKIHMSRARQLIDKFWLLLVGGCCCLFLCVFFVVVGGGVGVGGGGGREDSVFKWRPRFSMTEECFSDSRGRSDNNHPSTNNFHCVKTRKTTAVCPAISLLRVKKIIMCRKGTWLWPSPLWRCPLIMWREICHVCCSASSCEKCILLEAKIHQAWDMQKRSLSRTRSLGAGRHSRKGRRWKQRLLSLRETIQRQRGPWSPCTPEQRQSSLPLQQVFRGRNQRRCHRKKCFF